MRVKRKKIVREITRQALPFYVLMAIMQTVLLLVKIEVYLFCYIYLVYSWAQSLTKP